MPYAPLKRVETLKVQWVQPSGIEEELEANMPPTHPCPHLFSNAPGTAGAPVPAPPNPRPRPYIPWEWENPYYLWETRFNELKEYKEQHGDCDVPQRKGQLGTWVSRQRTSYNNKKLPADRIRLLDGIGFKWKVMGDYTVRTWCLSEQDSLNDPFTGVEDGDDSVQSFRQGAPPKAIMLGRNQRSMNKAEQLAGHCGSIPSEINFAVPATKQVSRNSAVSQHIRKPGYRPQTSRPNAIDRFFVDGRLPSWMGRSIPYNNKTV